MNYFLFTCLVVVCVGWWLTVEELKIAKFALKSMKRHSEYGWDRSYRHAAQLGDVYKEIAVLKNEIEYWKNRAKVQEAAGSHAKNL